ncbi:hypothetical protein FRB99_005770 [Tulasnella sp. 403]|nr:hypothetical protein FRB99_005770 [Tulasnella sp. 403]
MSSSISSSSQHLQQPPPLRPSNSTQSVRNNPASALSPATTGSPSSSSRAGVGQAPLTVDAALAQANGDPIVALDAVVNERNMISNQNAQLWKLIEKQRAAYSSLLKEHERVRGDRGKTQSKGDASGATHDSGLKVGLPSSSSLNAKIRPSPSTPSAPSTIPHKSSSVDDSDPSSTPSRPRVSRHQSDQSAPDGRSTSPRTLPSPHTPESSTLSTRTSTQDTINGVSTSAASSSIQPVSSSNGMQDITPRTRPIVQRHASDPNERHVKSPSVDTSVSVPQLSLTSPQSSVSGASLQAPSPVQSASQSSPSASTNLESSPIIIPDPPASSSLTPASASTTSTSPFQPRPRASARVSRISLPDEASRYIASMVDSPVPSPRAHAYHHTSSQPLLATSLQPDSQMGNANSRTRSPQADKLEADGTSPPGEGPAPKLTQEVAVGSLDSDDYRSRQDGSPIEEMYAESIISVSSRRSPKPENLAGDEDPFDAAETMSLEQLHDTDIDSSASAPTQSTGIAGQHHTSPQPQYPLPTQSGPSHEADDKGRHLPNLPHRESSERSISSTSSLPYSNDPLSRSQAALKVNVPESVKSATTSPRSGMEPPPDSPTGSGLSTGSTNLGYSEGDPSPGHSASRTPLSSQASGYGPFGTQGGGTPRPPQFKSTRLTVNDLPYTKVKIHGSNIKTNDRGKEVMSFLFTVFPAGDGDVPANPLRRHANGEGASSTTPDNWMIEKLYSEIVALDGNIRSKLGKMGGKKLAPLPDGKLFKDHAPAKADARKAILETYMQSLVTLPLKDKNPICMFLSTDLVRGPAVMNADHKEGYLTKRGKNFGGWKTRYFVLQSPVLEYYESRGGQHLGSIAIAGAQIGRQQRNSNSRDSDDENSYRHAFLIIEAKKGPAGSSIRHVLCAETDEERDAWVDLLVKYVVAGQNGGRYPLEEETRNSTSTAASEPPLNGYHPSTSASSTTLYSSTSTARGSMDPRQQWVATRRDDVPKPSLDSFSESASSNSGLGSAPTDASVAKRMLDRGSPEVPLSSSLPSHLDQASGGHQPPRANSELGHYPDMAPGHTSHPSTSSGADHRASPNGTTSTLQASRQNRASFHPSHTSLKSSASVPDRSASPEKLSLGDGKVKISGPMNGTPIPAGYKFGNEATPDRSDRDRKAKSRGFWAFGRNPMGSASQTGLVSRAVFGVPLDVSLAVSRIADLPAVVFRCIEYLEAKSAEQEEGIYRLSGSSNVIKSLKERFNTEGDVDLLKSDEYWDLHAITGLLKTFFRDLPNSILTRELHMKFLGVIDLANQTERIDELASLVSQLPLPNYSLLRALTAHLILIVSNAHINKMTMRNVGIVFSPTLGIPAGVFSMMLGEFERVFNVNGAGGDVAKSDEDPVVEGTISNRNSRSYADGAADKLLGLSGRTLKATEEESDDAEDEINAESSGTETENDTQDTSPPDTPGPTTYANAGVEGTPTRSHVPHSASVAAQRGLQVSIAPGANRRVSGLPSSPRPRMLHNNSSSSASPSSPLTATVTAPRV